MSAAYSRGSAICHGSEPGISVDMIIAFARAFFEVRSASWDSQEDDDDEGEAEELGDALPLDEDSGSRWDSDDGGSGFEYVPEAFAAVGLSGGSVDRGIPPN